MRGEPRCDLALEVPGNDVDQIVGDGVEATWIPLTDSAGRVRVAVRVPNRFDCASLDASRVEGFLTRPGTRLGSSLPTGSLRWPLGPRPAALLVGNESVALWRVGGWTGFLALMTSFTGYFARRSWRGRRDSLHLRPGRP